jgi:hypothetical protein
MNALFDSYVSRVLLAPPASVRAESAVLFRAAAVTQVAHRRWLERSWITSPGRSLSGR